MTKFPLLNQIFFWKRNRIYKLILKDKKLYGIYLDGQFHSAQTYGFIVYSVIYLISAFIYIFLSDLIIPKNIELFLLDTQLGTFLFVFITFSFTAWAGNLVVNNFKPVKNLLKKVSIDKLSSKNLLTEKHLQFINENKEKEFLSFNTKNFILNTDQIDKSETSNQQFWVMWPETHYGQLKLTLKDGSKKNFILTEDKLDILYEINKSLK